MSISEVIRRDVDSNLMLSFLVFVRNLINDILKNKFYVFAANFIWENFDNSIFGAWFSLDGGLVRERKQLLMYRFCKWN